MKHRWLIGVALTASAVALPAALASAGTPDPPREAYPPSGTRITVVDPGDPGDPGKLPATGADGTGTWLKMGAGAVLAGSIAVAATARRRRAVVST